MADWPSIENPSRIVEGHFKAQVRTEFEGGYVHTRARHTRSRKWFKIFWDLMPYADLATLLTFFDANLGGTFNWTHPITSTAYVVRFSEDEITYKHVGPAGAGWYSVETRLEEK